MKCSCLALVRERQRERQTDRERERDRDLPYFSLLKGGNSVFSPLEKREFSIFPLFEDGKIIQYTFDVYFNAGKLKNLLNKF